MLSHYVAWHQPGDKPLSEPMMVRLPMHEYVSQPQYDMINFLHDANK